MNATRERPDRMANARQSFRKRGCPPRQLSEVVWWEELASSQLCPRSSRAHLGVRAGGTLQSPGWGEMAKGRAGAAWCWWTCRAGCGGDGPVLPSRGVTKWITLLPVKGVGGAERRLWGRSSHFPPPSFKLCLRPAWCSATEDHGQWPEALRGSGWISEEGWGLLQLLLGPCAEGAASSPGAPGEPFVSWKWSSAPQVRLVSPPAGDHQKSCF